MLLIQVPWGSKGPGFASQLLLAPYHKSSEGHRSGKRPGALRILAVVCFASCVSFLQTIGLRASLLHAQIA